MIFNQYTSKKMEMLQSLFFFEMVQHFGNDICIDGKNAGQKSCPNGGNENEKENNSRSSSRYPCSINGRRLRQKQ